MFKFNHVVRYNNALPLLVFNLPSHNNVIHLKQNIAIIPFCTLILLILLINITFGEQAQFELTRFP